MSEPGPPSPRAADPNSHAPASRPRASAGPTASLGSPLRSSDWASTGLGGVIHRLQEGLTRAARCLGVSRASGRDAAPGG